MVTLDFSLLLPSPDRRTNPRVRKIRGDAEREIRPLEASQSELDAPWSPCPDSLERKDRPKPPSRGAHAVLIKEFVYPLFFGYGLVTALRRMDRLKRQRAAQIKNLFSMTCSWHIVLTTMV